MTVSIRPFFTAQYAPNAETTMYTASGVRSIIDKFVGFNGTAGNVTLTVHLVPNASAAGVTNVIVMKSIAAGETYAFPELVGHYLEAGGFISLIAGAAASIVIRAGGREVS